MTPGMLRSVYRVYKVYTLRMYKESKKCRFEQ
jgi:hypothetical protein